MYEISKYDPCHEAIEFRSKFNSFAEAWEACPRGDWMLWIASKVGVETRTLTLAKGYCAKTVIHLMKDKRSRAAVKAAIAFGKGKISREELTAAAAYAAAAAAAAAYADAAAAAAAAAYAYAAYAATAAAAAAAAYADADAAAAAAKKENQLKTAKICLKYLTKAVMDLI